MGLSDEERVSKFYRAMCGWRRSLVKLQNVHLPEAMSYEQPRYSAEVGSWIATLDDIVGMQIERTNTNSAYWIFGSNENGYRSHFENTYGLGNRPSIEEKSKRDSLSWWISHTDIVIVAAQLNGHPFSHNSWVAYFAAWWEQWNWVDAILYPVRRYEDNVFSEKVKAALTRLIGEMANRRYDMFSEHTVSDENVDECCATESALLAKYRLVHLLFTKESSKIWKLVRNDKQRLAMRKKEYEDRFDGHALIARVGKMSLFEVKSLLDAEEERLYNERSKQDKKRFEEEQEKKKKDPKYDGILGPPTRTKEELRRIWDTSLDLEECRKAAEELEHYGVSWGGWEAAAKARIIAAGVKVKKSKKSKKGSKQ